MAVLLVNKKQVEGTAATLAITAATAGNILVAFIMQSASVAAPTAKDNISGSTGWTVNATTALSKASKNSLWVATKAAVGGETELNPTPAGAGAILGIGYFELSGASQTVDAIVHSDNNATAKTVTSPEVTTTNAGDVILACVGFSEAIGTVSAWTGTGPMTNVATLSTRCLCGSYIPGTTVTAATFTANWETARGNGMLVVAIKPAVAGVEVQLVAAASTASASTVVQAPTGVALASAPAASAAASAPTARTILALSEGRSLSVAAAPVTAATAVPVSASTSTSGGIAGPTAATTVAVGAGTSQSAGTCSATAAVACQLTSGSSTSHASGAVIVVFRITVRPPTFATINPHIAIETIHPHGALAVIRSRAAKAAIVSRETHDAINPHATKATITYGP